MATTWIRRPTLTRQALGWVVKLRAASVGDLEALQSFEQYVETVRRLRSYDAWTGEKRVF